MICCAVIDTNVLVSALLSSKDNTATVQLVRKVIGGEIIPVYSNVITKECREVLSRKKSKYLYPFRYSFLFRFPYIK